MQKIKKSDMIQEYFMAFERKDLDTIKSMFKNDVILQDPFVGKVEGIESVIQIYKTMFAENSFNLQLRRRYQRNEYSYAIEFHLVVTDAKGEQTLIDGIDLIEFVDGKISYLRAYLDMTNNE